MNEWCFVYCDFIDKFIIFFFLLKSFECGLFSNISF